MKNLFLGSLFCSIVLTGYEDFACGCPSLSLSARKVYSMWWDQELTMIGRFAKTQEKGGLPVGHDLTPSFFNVGKEPQLNHLAPYTEKTRVHLTPGSPVTTLQYDNEFAGFPYFVVAEVHGDVQIQLSYAEQFNALLNPNSDGPWTFSVELANMFRIETFNITGLGRTQSFLVQGGQRWESIRLLTSGSVTFSAVGFKLSTTHTPAENYPGQFSSSDPLLQQLFEIGGRCVESACVEKFTQPSTWELTGDGALIRSQQTAQSAKGTMFSNYTLEFSTKIQRGGAIFRIASAIFPSGPIFVLNTEKTASTFVNTNLTLVPRNTLVFNNAFTIQNQTTNDNPSNRHFPIPFPLKENVWYRVKCNITTEGYDVSADGRKIAFVPFDTIPGSGSSGTWGFGAFQDQAAYFKDVIITARNGTVLYENPLTSKDILAEYGIDTNDRSLCMDGAKRDRLVWIGDFFHTPRTVGATTGRLDIIADTIRYVFDSQLDAGQFAGYVNINGQLGTRPEFKQSFENQSYGRLFDYQDEFLCAVGDWYELTGDAGFFSHFWTQLNTLVAVRLRTINAVTGLQTTSGFTGPANGTATSALTALALQRVVPIAKALGHADLADEWTAAAEDLKSAINTRLWNPAIGTYSLSLDAPKDFSIAATAYTIRAGIANSSQAASAISKIPELRLGVGFKDSSAVVNANDTRLSPNVNGFLLDSLFIANQTFGTSLSIADTLLRTFWAQMVNQPQYYSGSSWEYEFPDGSPGIFLFTSLAHPWGSAPSYVLPKYVLGISPIEPGYRTWQFRPLIHGLGLHESSGTVPTPHGPIEATWSVQHGRVLLRVKAPAGTSGLIVPPANRRFEGSSGSTMKVRGGSEHEFVAWL